MALGGPHWNARGHGAGTHTPVLAQFFGTKCPVCDSGRFTRGRPRTPTLRSAPRVTRPRPGSGKARSGRSERGSRLVAASATCAIGRRAAGDGVDGNSPYHASNEAGVALLLSVRHDRTGRRTGWTGPAPRRQPCQRTGFDERSHPCEEEPSQSPVIVSVWPASRFESSDGAGTAGLVPARRPATPVARAIPTGRACRRRPEAYEAR